MLIGEVCLGDAHTKKHVEDDSETFRHSRLLRLRAVDELVNKLMHSVNKPKALKYIQLWITIKHTGHRPASV